jgi:hypothetical protein
MQVDLADWAVLIAGLVVIGGCIVLYNWWLYRSQPDDLPLIKAQLEANEHRVIDIRRDGFVAGSRYRPAYRKYMVRVRSPLGGPDEIHIVGVQAGLFAFRQIHEFGPVRHRDFDRTIG